MKKLCRIPEGKIIAGVCTGIGDYTNIDPNIIRLIAILTGFWGPGLIAYIIAAIILPIRE